MFLGKKPNRLAPSAKSRLNTHTHSHKLESVEPSRKKSPDGNSPGPPSPSEVLVFNTHHGGSTRAGHYNRSLPEVPNIDDIHRFMKDSWDERVGRINNPANKLNVLWMKSFAEEEREREEASKAAAATAISSAASNSSAISTITTARQASIPQSNHHPHQNSTKTASSSSASSSASSTPTASSSQHKNYSSPQHNKKSNRD